jgi:Flp pilus assembly protein TadD
VPQAQAEHNYDECVKLLSEIIVKQPRNTDAFNSRGTAYAKLKQFEKAIQDYNQATFTHQLVGGISDHNLGNAGASVVVGAHGKTVSTC